MTYYKQCTYRDENGLTETAWIPSTLGVVGKKIFFGKKSDTNRRLFEVVSAGDLMVSEEYLVGHERDYKTQREASDI